MLFWDFVFQFIFGVPIFVLLNGVFIYGWHHDRRKNGTSFWMAIEEIIAKLGPKDFFVMELEIFITICLVMLFVFVPHLDAIYGEVSSIFAFLGVPGVYVDPAFFTAAAILSLTLLFMFTSLCEEEEWDIPLMFTLLTESISEDRNEYTTHERYSRNAKWKGRVAQLIGDTFQCLFLKRTYLKAVKNSLFNNFGLATEMDDAGKFDDVCIKWDASGREKKWILIQIKHRNTAEGHRSASVTCDDLFHAEGNKQQDFSVMKYVSSIIDIESTESMKGSKAYVLLTNAKLDSTAQQDWFIQADLTDELKELIPNHSGCWKLKREKFLNILENAIEEKRLQLADAIKALFRNHLSNNDRVNLKKYTAVLHRDVLVYRDKEYRFTKKFAQTNAKRSQEEKLLWKLLFEGDDCLKCTDTTKLVTSEEISAKGSSKTLPLRYSEEQINLLVENFIFSFEQPDTDGLKQEIVQQLKAHNPMSDKDAENYNKKVLLLLSQKLTKSG